MKTILTIMMLAAMCLPAFAQDEMPRRLQIVQADLDDSGELTNVRREDVRLCEDEDTELTSANLRDITHTDVNRLPGHEANHGMVERYRASCQHGENLYTLVASGPVSARNYIRNTDWTTAYRPDWGNYVVCSQSRRTCDVEGQWESIRRHRRREVCAAQVVLYRYVPAQTGVSWVDLDTWGGTDGFGGPGYVPVRYPVAQWIVLGAQGASPRLDEETAFEGNFELPADFAVSIKHSMETSHPELTWCR